MSEPNVDDKRRFDDLVLWYLAGTLDDQERQWMDHYLRRHPEAASAVAAHEALASAVRASAPKPRRAPGLEHLMQRVERDLAARKGPGLLQRVMGFIDSLAVRPVLATACLLLVVQGAGLGLLLRQTGEQREVIDTYSQTRALSGTSTQPYTEFHVTFRDAATERDIRLLLKRFEGQIVGGPGDFGRYILSVPKQRADDAQAALESSDAVDGHVTRVGP